MKRLYLATATAIALSAAAPALAGVRCYSVFNVQTGRVETICRTGN